MWNGLFKNFRQKWQVGDWTVVFQYILIEGVFFLSRGLTIAVLKSDGTRLEGSKVMMSAVVGRRASRFSYSNSVGMGSRSHDLGTVFWRISETNCSVTGVNVCSNFPE